MNMGDSMRSGGVLKKKSSSGCLIIKKKVENGNLGRGWEGLGSHIKERKRPRFVAGELGVSDDDESMEFKRRKMNEKILHSGSIGYRRGEFEHREYEKSIAKIDLNGERMRRRSTYEHDESYNEFNERKTGEEYVNDRYKMFGCRGGDNSKDFIIGSSHRNVVEERRHSLCFDGSSSERSKGGEHGGLRNKGFDLEGDEEMPVPLMRLKYPEVADEPIRLQGKNGVLKVMVNKKKKLELHSRHNRFDSREVEERARCRSEDATNKDLLSRMPIYLVPKPPVNRGPWMEKEKMDMSEGIKVRDMETEKEKVKPRLSKGTKVTGSEIIGMSEGIKVRDMESDITDTALKLAPPGLQVSTSKKLVKKEEERAPPENITSVERKEGKVKRGGCTEKQMLREKIREMLIDKGWTIDYRPRRNRDYLDAVYISPSGTAYWSIIKAYEAFKKQLEEDNLKSKVVIDSPSIAPLPENLISKLTRQTKKKIEEELKRKRKEDGIIKSGKISSVRADGESSDSDRNKERVSSCRNQNHKFQRSKFPDVDQGSDDGFSDDSPKRKSKKIKVEKDTSASTVLQERTSKVIGRCTLLVRCSGKGENSESDGYVPYTGKRTVLAWLIDSGTAQLSEKVQYMNRRRNRVMLEGWITRDGIHCGCCSKILAVSKFELHAGSKLRQPFQNIFLESGPSLLQCQIDAWNRQGESVLRDFHTVGIDGDDPDDDACGICGDGGALICCDSCPSTFHQICLEIQKLPSGDWHCPNCICKFCGDAGGRDTEENSDSDELTRCSFCERKYHKSCTEEVPASSVSSIVTTFCGPKCQELYDHLQKILGVKHELEGGFSWSLIQRADISDTSHRGFPQRVESNSKLAVALSVMNECFLPIIDRRSGINMIRNVVYNVGSNFNRLNYCGFYTIILEKGDEIVSAASIRIQGTHLAEMPFIGTRKIYRRQGMCRRLLSAIETELRSLKVKQLIIPAILEHMNTWTSAFGFHPLEGMLKKAIKSMNMLVFPGTDMLQKSLAIDSDGMKVPESIKNQSPVPVMVEKLDMDSLVEYEKQMSNYSEVGHDIKVNDKVCTSDSVCEPNTLASNRTIMVKSEVEVSAGSDSPPTVHESKKTVQNKLHGPPKKNTSPFEAVVGSTCTNEAPYVKSEHISLMEEALANSAATTTSDTKIGTVESSILNGDIYDSDGCDGKEVLPIKRNLEALSKVPRKDVSEKVWTLLDSRDTDATINSGIEQTATGGGDGPSLETETALLVDGEIPT